MIENSPEIEKVLSLLQRDDAGRDAVALLVVKLIELRFPEVKAEFATESELKIIDGKGESSTFYLNNLWIECEQTPQNRAEIVDRYVRAGIHDTGNQEREAIERGRVVALVKDTQYCDLIPETDRQVVSRHLAGDLWIMLALDLPDSTVSLSAEKAAKFAMDADSLFRLGTENVSEMLTEISFEPEGECFSLSAANLYYGASILLLDYVWPQVEGLVEGDIVLAVPARDTVLITGSKNLQGLQEIREHAHYVVTNGHHLISETLLRRVDGAWEVFQ